LTARGGGRDVPITSTAFTAIEGSARRVSGAVGLNQKTVAKWRKRAFVHEAPMGPKVVRSTVLTAEEEAAVIAFRKRTASRASRRTSCRD
jgi:hypothetical protein